MRAQPWEERRAEYLQAKGVREWEIIGPDGRVIRRAVVPEQREEASNAAIDSTPGAA